MKRKPLTNHVAMIELVLRRCWPHEANMAGHQNVRLIAQHIGSMSTNTESLVRQTNGEHAYGIAEALNTLISVATLIVAYLQLENSRESHAKERAELFARLKELTSEKYAQQLAKELERDEV